MKKILLFGSSGLLGSALYETLFRHNYVLVCPQRPNFDLTDVNSLTTIIKETAADVIINAAARINVNELDNDPLSGWEVNAIMAGMVAKIIAQSGMQTPYVFISTNYVFGDSPVGRTEDDIPFPINTYGKTKALGESLVAQYSEERPFFIVRTGWLYGKSRPTYVDEVASALLKGQHFKASVDQFGNPTSAVDFAGALLTHILKGKRESGIYHLFNATGPAGVSRYEIAKETARILHAQDTLVQKGEKETLFNAKRPSAVLLNTKLPPLQDWKEALKAYLVPNS